MDSSVTPKNAAAVNHKASAVVAAYAVCVAGIYWVTTVCDFYFLGGRFSRGMRAVFAVVISAVFVAWLSARWFSKAIGSQKSKSSSITKSLSKVGSSDQHHRDPLDAYRSVHEHSDLSGQESVERFWSSADTTQPQSARQQPARDIRSFGDRFLFMASTKFVSCFTQQEFQQLYDQIEWEMMQPNTAIFHEGDEPTCMYIIVEGNIAVCREVNGNMVTVSSLHRGDSIGEFGLVLGEKHVFTAVTQTEAQLIRITKELFDSVVLNRPAALVNFIKTTLSREWHIAEFALSKFLRLPPSKYYSNSPLSPSVRRCVSAEDAADTDTTQSAAAASGPRTSVGGTARNGKAVEHVTEEWKANPLGPDVAKQAEADRRRGSVFGTGQLLELGSYFPTDHAELKRLASSENCKTLQAGEVLVREGQHVDRVYVLLKGRVAVNYGAPHRLDGHRFDRGAVLGALGYYTSTAYCYTLRTLRRCTVAWYTKEDLEENTNPSTINIAVQICRLAYPSLRRFWRYGFQRQWRPSGSFLFKEGDNAEHIYVIVSGRVRLEARQATSTDADQRGHMARVEMGLGQCVGEVSFLAGYYTHSMSAVCIRDTEIVRLSRPAFRLVTMRYPQALIRFSQVMARRFRDMVKRRPEVSQYNSIVVFPTQSQARKQCAHFAQKLTSALEAHGPTLHLNAAKIDDVLGLNASSNMSNFYERSRLYAYLSQQEETYEFVVYEVDPVQHLVWTQCCVRAADCVLLVGDAKGSPDVGRMEKELVWAAKYKVHARKTLILLHSDDTHMPKGTRAWLEARNRPMYYHVRLNSDRHYARVARGMAGTSMGLVLSGGGARGLAHLGVLRALEENNVVVDFIAGTSQGSFMAAVFGIQETYEESRALTSELAGRMGNMWDLLSDATFPIMAYFSGKGLNESIQSLLGKDTEIEDLWIRYFCVTTNLSRSDMDTHFSGKLWKAVRCSMSILGYLPPMWHTGELLIDGGYVNNLPVDVMRRVLKPKFIVAVDVQSKDAVELYGEITNFGDSLSGWWLLWQRTWNAINPFSRPLILPSFSEILSTLTFVNNNQIVRQAIDSKMIDLYLRPELGDTNLLDYHKMDQIAGIGYDCAVAKLKEWLQTHEIVPSVGLVRQTSEQAPPPKDKYIMMSPKESKQQDE